MKYCLFAIDRKSSAFFLHSFAVVHIFKANTVEPDFTVCLIAE